MLKREDILSMVPGRELDALIAEKVMEWKDVSNGTGVYLSEIGIELHSHIRHYSTNISDAWEVVEKMHELGGLEIGCLGRKEHPWFTVSVYSQKWGEIKHISTLSAPHAISIISLLAVME
jgi:hypothetical protein